jgi:DNA repair exonuclease SbcCD ATPase subunit
MPGDRREDHKVRLRYEATLAAYGSARAVYETWLDDRRTKQLRLLCLHGVETELALLKGQADRAMVYDAALIAYTKDLARYDELLAAAEAKSAEAEGYAAATAALKGLKLRIKTYLIPSLNRVASHLVREMTTGQVHELDTVIVDEEFNITVDGQSIDTLNGSGKTVANLAVRIALGQILTNKMFSVLMCDEVDAACDDDRAEAIAACLRGLTKTIGQVIVVSHKNIEADHYLKLHG